VRSYTALRNVDFFVVMSSWEDPVGIIVSARSSLFTRVKNTKTNVDWLTHAKGNHSVSVCVCGCLFPFVCCPPTSFLSPSSSVYALSFSLREGEKLIFAERERWA
jgi:hypothetical protein